MLNETWFCENFFVLHRFNLRTGTGTHWRFKNNFEETSVVDQKLFVTDPDPTK
jgi:hypothetical protein